MLDGANSTLSVVAADLTGGSGRAILAALPAGQADAATRAHLAHGRLRAKIPQLEQGRVGRMGPHQRFLLAEQLAHLDALDESLLRLSAEVVARLHPFEEDIAPLDTITGLGRRTAEALIAEIGVARTRFPSADHLTAWAGLAPGNNLSAGKRKSGKTRKGSPALRAILVEAAQAAGRSKDTYLGALSHRLAARRGKKRAAVAVARKTLIIVYHSLTCAGR